MARSQQKCIVEVEWTYATYSPYDSDAVKRTGMQKRQERPRAPEQDEGEDEGLWEETDVDAEERQGSQGSYVLTSAVDTPQTSLPQTFTPEMGGACASVLFRSGGKF